MFVVVAHGSVVGWVLAVIAMLSLGKITKSKWPNYKVNYKEWLYGRYYVGP